jgi:hypothetical protein
MGTVAGTLVGQGGRLFVSAAAESPFGTAQTLTHCLIDTLSSEPLEPEREVLSDVDFSSGNGSDIESSEITLGYKFAANRELHATLESIGIFLAKCMAGGDTVGGSPAPYTHTMLFSALPGYLPGMTLEQHLGATVAGVSPWSTTTDRKFLGVCVDSFEFSCSRVGNARINVGLIGSGKVASGSSITEANLTGGTPIPSALITMPKVRVTIEPITVPGTSVWDGTLEVGTSAGGFPAVDAGANVSNISAYLQDFKFKVYNGASDSEREAGSSDSAGTYLGQAKAKVRGVDVEFTVEHGTPIDQLLHAQMVGTQFTILLNIAADTANRGLMIPFAVCSLRSKPGGYTGKGPLSGSYKFKSLSSASYQPIKAYLVNEDGQDYC